jgi:hypothetical protein
MMTSKESALSLLWALICGAHADAASELGAGLVPFVSLELAQRQCSI